MLCTVPTFAADIDRVGFTESSLLKYVENAVVIRAGNFECYANNYREGLYGGRTDITPFVDNGKIYVPVEYIFDHYNIKYEITSDDAVKANINDKEILLSEKNSETDLKRKNCVLYGEGGYLASLVSTGYFSFDDMCIFSDNISGETVISDSDKQSLKNHLSYNWKSVYLGALGYATGIVIHPKNPHLKYLRTDNGGVYKFDEKNNMWINLLDNIKYDWKSMLCVSAFCLDPNDENVIYCSTGTHDLRESDIIKSTDGGKTWNRLGFDSKFSGASGAMRFAGEAIQVDPNNSDYVYAGSGKNGLFISKNGGKNWSVVSSIPTVSDGVSFVYIYGDEKSKNCSKTVYVGVCGYGVYISTNGGATFSLMQNSPMNPQRMYKAGSKLYVSSVGDEKNGGMFYYENDTWHNITPSELSKKYGVCAFVIDKNNYNTIICQGVPYHNNTKYRSLDGGKTWENMGSTNNHGTFVQDSIEEKGFWAPFGAGVHFIEDMYADKFNEYVRDKGVEQLVCCQLESMPTSKAPRLIQQCMDWGQIVVDRLDTRYKISTPSIALSGGIDFCEEDPSFVFRGGLVSRTLGSMAASFDYGRTFTATSWVEGVVPLDVALSATKQANGYPIVMAYASDDSKTGPYGLYRSLDYGSTWEKCNSDFATNGNSYHTPYKRLVSDRVNGDTFYYNDNGAVYVTEDAGLTWDKRCQTLKTFETYFAAIPGIEGGLWVKDGNSILATYNKGRSWQSISNVDYAVCFGFGIGKGKDNIPACYVYGKVNGVFGVYISDDLGNSWRRINDNGSSVPNDVYAVRGDRINYGRVYLSTGGNGTYYGEPIDLDDHEPVITMKTQSSTDDVSVNYAVGSDTCKIEGSLSEPGVVHVNGIETETDGYNNFSVSVKLSEGINKITVEAHDEASNYAEPITLSIRYIKNFFEISYNNDKEIRTKDKNVHISGVTGVPATVYVGGLSVKTDENNCFDVLYPVTMDEENVNVYAIDDNGIQSDTNMFKIIRDFDPPVASFETIPEKIDTRNYLIKGSLNEKGQIRINDTTINIDDNNKFLFPIKLRNGENVVKYQTRDVGKNTSEPKYLTLFCDATDEDTTHFTADYLSNNFVFDGNVDEWNLNHGCNIVALGNPNNIITFGVMYDENYLYVGLNVVDDVISLKNDAVYQNDCIEIYIDNDYCKGGTKHTGWAQLLYPADVDRIVPNSIFKKTDDGYCAEIRIPWSDFNIEAKPGVRLGFELDMIDSDGNNGDYSRESVLCFNGSMDNFKFKVPYSELTLGGK